MIHRVVFEEPPRRRRLAPVKVVTPALALVLGAVALGEWACAPRAAQIGPRATNALVAQAAAPLPQQQTPPQPAAQQEAAPAPQPASLAQLDAQMATAMRGVPPEEVERRVNERAQQAAAQAFPVAARMEMSSTMYCLKGHMRTGVRTRDGMAAGDPSVLPLGSVVRVSRPSGELIGIFVIMDTGGAIRGNKIDLYVDSCHEAERWGRHPVVAEVLAIGKRI
ncbi:MAG TPA: 3D domain-containing protein [Longimicrobium sp.]|nr:3D domain-containing protein [Longimicrobium sp.]